jgi:cytochrome c-type biogenesis protein CcmF
VTRLLGYDAILIALALSLYGIGALAVGVRRKHEQLVASGYAAVYTNFALMTISTGAMVYALVTHDFSIEYVAQVGSRATPLFYTIISLWGALEGSILFWAWVLAMYTAVAVYLNRSRPGGLIPCSAAVLLAISVFFYILLTGPANPFGLVSPAPADGPGPNPLLQNHPLMAVHPPLLYLGYVGMSIPFAFAMGAILAGEQERDDWIRLSRRWTLSAWMFLSAAIIAGMWWSYEVLGWGGYWAWDPVENASFMPWLTATAFLHSVMVQERRGMLKLWNLNLISATFLLTILGTFLTRSGIVSSVHAFTQGTIGYYFLAFIAVTLLASLALIGGAGGTLRSTGRLDSAISRESVFLLNNLLLTAFTFTVVLGTLFPLVAEMVRGVKVSVGAPFFNRMTVPLCAALLFLMGVGPALPWRRATPEEAKRKLFAPTVGFVLAVIASLLIGARDPYAIAAFGFAAFALVSNLTEFGIGTRARMRSQGEAAPVAFGRLIASTPRRYGGYTAHLGVVIIAAAIAASSTFKAEHEQTLRPGETATLRDYGVRLEQMWGRQEPHRMVVAAQLTVLKDGKAVGTLDPRMNFYATQQEPVPTPAVRSRPSGDLYVNLMAFAQDGSTATVRVILEPLVPWIWFGGGVVCLGALISMAGSRRRRTAEVAEARPVAPAPRAPVPIPAAGVVRHPEGAQS